MYPITCHKCKGKGYTFNLLSLLLTIGLPIALLIDKNQKSGITKTICKTCKGGGIIYYPMSIRGLNIRP